MANATPPKTIEKLLKDISTGFDSLSKQLKLIAPTSSSIAITSASKAFKMLQNIAACNRRR